MHQLVTKIEIHLVWSVEIYSERGAPLPPLPKTWIMAEHYISVFTNCLIQILVTCTSNRWIFCFLNFLILTLKLHGSNMVLFFGHGRNQIKKLVFPNFTTS